MRLIFVRHPETEALVKKIIYGRTNSPYTEKGKRSIPWVRDQLLKEDVAQIYSSPLHRTRTLAEEIAKSHADLPLIIDERITEMSVGILEQMTLQEAQKAHPEHVEPFLADFGNYKIPGSELFSEVEQRVAGFLEEIILKEEVWRKEGHPERPIIVVSHSMAIRAALAYLFKVELSALWHIKVNPAAIIKVKYKDGFALLEGLADPHEIIE
ncbi:MAG: histidine phosphatase family protein [Clostridia bacterium]|nr:histidine phosphatase family protein [Clostridia bacterium]